MRRTISIRLLFLTISFILWIPFLAAAQSSETGVTLNPHIIDAKGEAGGIFEYSIELSNQSDRKVSLYAVVNNLSAKEGRQEFSAGASVDRSRSLANWIEVTRGVQELDPGQTKNIPIRIDVSPNAQPGEYYASVTFAAGSNRYQAEAQIEKINQPHVLVNLIIEEHIVENAQINFFRANRKVFFQYPVSFSWKVTNEGNQPIKPVGEVFIYDRRGNEVAALPVSKSDQINPGDFSVYAADWKEKGGLGRFKAKLEMNYGQRETRDLQDAIFFWVLPWPWVTAFFIGVVVLFSALFYLLFRKARAMHHHLPLPESVQEEKRGVINLKNEQ
jgi:hypothetical protein